MEKMGLHACYELATHEEELQLSDDFEFIGITIWVVVQSTKHEHNPYFQEQGLGI